MADQFAVVVEDDPDIAHLVATTLSQAGFDTEIAESGPDALELVAEKNPALVTLDLALPGMDGVEVCRRLREISDCYVIMLTARDTEIDRLIGLEVGADDFMNKPFSTRELRARVAAMLRRPRAGTFNGGLAVWDGRSWSYPQPIAGAAGRKITCLAVDRVGGVWAGTHAGVAAVVGGVVAVVVKVALAATLLAAGEVFLAKVRLFRVPELLAGSFLLALIAVTASYFFTAPSGRIG